MLHRIKNGSCKSALRNEKLGCKDDFITRFARDFFFLFSGDHLIKVTFANREVAGSPFVAKAYNTKSIAVTRLKDGFVGQPIHFESESLLKNVKSCNHY